MSIYIFACPEHGPFEIERSILEPALRETECPTQVPYHEADDFFGTEDNTIRCGERSERVYSPPAVIFTWKN